MHIKLLGDQSVYFACSQFVDLQSLFLLLIISVAVYVLVCVVSLVTLSSPGHFPLHLGLIDFLRIRFDIICICRPRYTHISLQWVLMCMEPKASAYIMGVDLQKTAFWSEETRGIWAGQLNITEFAHTCYLEFLRQFHMISVPQFHNTCCSLHYTHSFSIIN